MSIMIAYHSNLWYYTQCPTGYSLCIMIKVVATPPSRSSPPDQRPPATYPNNVPFRNRGMMGPMGSPYCFGCYGKDHMLGDCPRMRDLLKNGILIFDAVNRKYCMPDGGSIMRRNGESIADAALRNQTMTL